MNEKNGSCDIGLIGLGVMGRNFVLNLGDHGFSVIGYDKDAERVSALEKEADSTRVRGARSLKEFLDNIRKPRAVMMLVPAGAPVDSVIDELSASLDEGDVVIDGGNSHFTDTNLHLSALQKRGITLLGVGISGGESGARRGPSIMPGGAKEAYERVRPLFEAASAHVDGDPCVAYLGKGSAGHYVKMVHNGIEYALMQMIAESYDVLKRGLGLDDDELHRLYDEWNRAELDSFLMEITAKIFLKSDPKSNQRLVDVILDEARQKGTGKWTSQDAMELQSPAFSIHAAVAMRDMSSLKDEREDGESMLSGPDRSIPGDREETIRQLRDALYFGMVTAYAQGFSQLAQASGEYGYDLNLPDIARIWRGGCIIRAGVLENIRAAFAEKPGLANLMIDARFSAELLRRQESIRRIVAAAAMHGIPLHALSSALAYFDSYRSGWLPVNLVQAQRDYFGAHSYERVDAKGTFHTQWDKLDLEHEA